MNVIHAQGLREIAIFAPYGLRVCDAIKKNNELVKNCCEHDCCEHGRTLFKSAIATKNRWQAEATLLEVASSRTVCTT
jgi:hypothetical protein